MMAASSLIAATAALSPVHAADFDKAAFPTVVEAPLIYHTSDATPDDQQASPYKKNLALLAAMAGVLAALIKLIGLKNVVGAAGDIASKSVNVAKEVTGTAAKSAWKIVKSPLRFALLVAGLSFFALSGFGFYGVEWLGGIIVGATMMGVVAYSAIKVRTVLKPRPIKRQNDIMVNEN